MSQRKTVILSSEQKFQRRIFVVRHVNTHGILKTSVKFGISQRTLRDWRNRFNLFGIEGLRNKSTAPKNIWNKKDKDRVLEKEVLRLCKEEPGLNRLQIIGKLIFADTSEIATLSWLKRTKRRLGLTRKKRIKNNIHKTRYEIPIPGALQIDTKYVLSESGEYLYQFTAIDECTRVRFLGGSSSKGAEAARKFLVEAIKYYESLGVKVWRVQTDNGTEFTLPRSEWVVSSFIKGFTPKHIFTMECECNGIKHRLITVASPELNGKVERSHRIDEERFYSRFKFKSSYDLDHALKNIWMPEYNERRPHGSLGYSTPMDFLKKKLDELKNKNLNILIDNYEMKLAA